MKHSFIKGCNKTFNQINGTAMGWDPALLTANVALYSCEHIYFSSQINERKLQCMREISAQTPLNVKQ